MDNFINDDLDASSSDKSFKESDYEFDNGSDNDESSVSKIIKYKTNYLYSIGDYTVLNGIIEAALS